MTGVAVEEPGQIPATVRREGRHRVPALGEKAPQVLRRAHPAGEAAAHSDDHDRIVVHEGPARLGAQGLGAQGLCGRPQQFGARVFRQGERGRVVENGSGRQPQTGRGTQSVAEFDRCHGVEAEFLESAMGRHAFRVGMPEHHRDVAAHHVEQQSPLLGPVEPGQTPAESGPVTTRLLDGSGPRVDESPYFRKVGEQGTGPGRGEGGVMAFPLDVGDGDHRVALLNGRTESGHRQFGGECRNAMPPGHLTGFALPHTATGPQAPGHGGRHQALGPAALGQRIEEGVARCVVALPWCTDGPGQGGEEHERGQLHVAGQLMQMHRTVGLDAQYPVQLLGGQGLDRRIIQQGGRVHHSRQRTYLGYQRGQLSTVGHIALGHRHRRSGHLQVRDELGRPGRGHAAPARQHEVLRALLRQPPRDMAAQCSGPSGDQYGPARIPGRQVRPQRGGMGEPAPEGPHRPDRDLVLARST
ncbi:hypothetical protein SANT12839_011000 [Streptomyces antimycoticus]|uniref:Uncharacterized protein n=1 Tax=Streptomyces antimycoticus TaxID=68175 RepID=A0A4D4K0P7_9ACTN|nr:hypothetical protein SANT12839_011000 [Streptomyces antimycoticus]